VNSPRKPRGHSWQVLARKRNVMFLASLALALQPVPAYAPAAPLTAIRKIICGPYQGTAFVIGKGVLVSVDHVTSPGGCYDAEDGRQYSAYIEDRANDFSLLTGDTTGLPAMRYTCSRFRTGQISYAYGYGKGVYQIRPNIASPVYSTTQTLDDGTPFPGMRLLGGSLQSGMSGGPIISREGYVFGLNNISNGWTRTYSRELADTALCKK